MLRLSELTGFSVADLTEIISFFMGIGIVCVFSGNIMFRLFMEFIDMIRSFSGRILCWIIRHIEERQHN